MERTFGVMRDICLIKTPAYELQDDRLEPHLGLMYLATYARMNSIDAVVCDLSEQKSEEWQIPEAKLYGFTTFSTTYMRTLELVKRAKAINPDAITVAGGAHASALPNEVAKDFDYVVIGEGENALISIFGGRVTTNPVVIGDPIKNLDQLPYIDYSIADIDSYKRRVDGKKSFCILSSRGCPYKCLFCNSIIMGGHKPVRFRSPSNVIGEIKKLRNEYGDIGIRFQDDIFGSQAAWLETFTNLIKPLDIHYRAFVRTTQCCKDGFADKLYEGGCRHIAMGIETGSDVILNSMQKGQTVEQCRQGIKKAKGAGLIVRIYLIVGFPGETWDTVNETLELVKETQPDEFVVYPLIPYPGTPMYYHPEQYGLYNINPDFTHYFQICGDGHSEFVYDLKDYDRVELTAMKQYLVDGLDKLKIAWARDSKDYV